MFSWEKYQKPTIVLSPMSGITDSPFKQVVRDLTPDVVLVTEFVSSDAIFFESKKTYGMMEFDKKEHPVVLQVFGNTPEYFVKAAGVAEDMGYDGVDINMGCPARKIIRSDHGSALAKIENRETAMEIVAAMVKAVKIPVSVKTRIGWENAEELIPFCRGLEEQGCAAIAVHGRTTKQGYSGSANWEPIYALKKELNIPVFGNGDVDSVSAFRSKLGNLDGVYVGRGSLGDPWLLADLVEYAKNPDEYADLSDEELDEKFPRAGNIPWEVKLPVILKHYDYSVKIKGEERGVREMRKHVASYIKGSPGAKNLRMDLMQIDSYEDIKKLLTSV